MKILFYHPKPPAENVFALPACFCQWNRLKKHFDVIRSKADEKSTNGGSRRDRCRDILAQQVLLEAAVFG
ncbi:hypothetical protein BaRGS_00033874 [Batillaria attramentaria]|uniref:Uncharacterized protein n=1 Tax=Batillaria attramentaria TaxID=370345 RepID=A0ABD0JK87_9CAEN